MKKIILATALASLFAAPAFANHDWFGKADTNGDGAISKAEFNAAKDAKFAKKDANGDGKITKDEAKAYHDKHDDDHDHD